MTQTLDNAANRALQDIAETAANITNGIASWNDLRSIQSGLANYNGYGITPGAVPMFLNFDVDFGARTYGSATSYLRLDSPYYDEANISKTNFGSLSGSAVITLTSGVNSDNAMFNNSTITFENLNGVAAKYVVVNLAYQPEQGGSLITGEMAVPRVP